MLAVNLVLSGNIKRPMYLRLADYYKEEIRTGRLPGGARLPSIRKLAAALGGSRTTVETAYALLLAEGFIISEPKRGYKAVGNGTPSASAPESPEEQMPRPALLYDFASNYVDVRSLNTSLWRRCVTNTLKEPRNVAAYGLPQGETRLREVLAKYSYEARGVIAKAEQIVIGAGIQSLLQILLSLLSDGQKSAAIEEPGFPKAERIFRDHGWRVQAFQTEKLSKELPPLILVSPSNPYKGSTLSAEERLALLAWSRQTGGMIIEDDYNGEFRYFARPIGALQGLAGGANVIYLGSFSRILMPSLRISYMVLPPALLERYRKASALYNQTSSTIEQLTLAEFIAGGHLRRHVRRLRKLYADKNSLLRQALSESFAARAEVKSYASGLHVRLSVQTADSVEMLVSKAAAVGVGIIPVSEQAATCSPEILLSFAGIAEADIKPAIELLKQAWFG